MAWHTTESGKRVKGFYQFTDLSTAIDCPGPGTAVAIQAEAGDIRVRFDGVAPTSSVGQLIVENSICYFAGDLSRVLIIGAEGGAIANIHVFQDAIE